jgi:hypothetical protein
MKKLYTLFLLAVNAFAFSQATLPYYESFNYVSGSNLNGQGGWTGAAATPDDALISTGNLSYAGLAPSSGNSVTIGSNGFDPQQPFTNQTAGVVYASFIFKVTDLATLTDPLGGHFFGFGASSTNFASTVWLKANGTGFQIGLNKATGTADTQYLSTVYNINTEYFVVIAYDLGTVKTSIMWVNPTALNLGTATAPTASSTTIIGTDRTNIERVYIRQDSSTETPTIIVDEVRVGTTWASVTPTTLNVKQNSISGLNVFPNPVTNGVLYITSNSNEDKTVSIFDVLGKLVLKTNVTNQPINVSSLNKGVYILKITEEGQTATRKLVIK